MAKFAIIRGDNLTDINEICESILEARNQAVELSKDDVDSEFVIVQLLERINSEVTTKVEEIL